MGGERKAYRYESRHHFRIQKSVEELCKIVENSPCSNQTGRPSLTPPFLILYVLRVVKFNVTSTVVASNNHLYSTPFEIARRKWPDTTQTAWPKVHSRRGILWESGYNGPANGYSEDLIAR